MSPNGMTLSTKKNQTSSSLTIITTVFFFAEFCIFSYPGVYFQVFFLRNINWKVILPQSAYICNISHLSLYKTACQGFQSFFPSKHLETDHLKMPSVIQYLGETVNISMIVIPLYRQSVLPVHIQIFLYFLYIGISQLRFDA